MTTASDLASGLADLVDAVQALSSQPADQIDALIALCDVSGSGAVASGVRRLAIVALASATAAYQPSSYDEAISLAERLIALFDGEITAAGDAGQDDTFIGMQQLRTAVISDLMARGGSLAPLINVIFPQPLPAIVVAQRLYGDATRGDEVVQRVSPINPLFMPVTMQVLGS